MPGHPHLWTAVLVAALIVLILLALSLLGADTTIL